MDRRRFLQTVSATLFAAPLAAEAQQTGKVWRIGVLYRGNKSDAPTVLQPFLEGLRQLGYVEGKSMKLEIWSAESVQLRPIASDLVRAKPDIIVVASAGHAAIVQEFTKTLPIVVLSGGELVSLGVVASLAKPGGNVTGMQMFGPELMGKRLQILQELLPGLRRLVVVRVPVQWPSRNLAVYRQAVEDPATKLGLRVRYVGFDDVAELPTLFADIVKERDDAMLTWANPEMAVAFDRVRDLTIHHRLPTMCDGSGTWVRRGGLIAYGPRVADLYRQAATYVHRILKGANPADLPIGQPTTFELVINAKTAKAIGLTIPPSLLSRADQVIE